MKRAALAAALAAALTLTLTAGSCTPDKESAEEPAPDVSYQEELPPAPAGSEDPRNRQSVVQVPKGTSPRAVEFADADTGYALFSTCVSGLACQVGLVITLDGGQSWVARKVPFDDATEVEMRLGRGNVLLLRTVPGGWYVSRDTGHTFQQHPLIPAPPEVNLTEPRFSVGCLDGTVDCAARQPMEVTDDGKRTALPGRPAGDQRFTSLVAQGDGKLWLTAQAVETSNSVAPMITVSVWSSTDHGRTWRAEGTARLPQHSGVEPHVVVAPDGSDVWLATNQYAARRNAAGAWVEANAMREVAEVYSAEVLPGGLLLIASGQGVWTVDGDKRTRDQGGRLVFRLRRLSDTAILGYPAQQSGEVWLCAVKDKNCEWSRVAVAAR
ncbi:glycoside hydrolase [Dactylosporangium sp. NBC_01737]|uniref:sialidase family protein n=1 Tax=Dactylosporangium sp. NBC_01737 TaxID=2975959 RepID=UPI002E11363E|nr:glycoside hydrolase [Dactylosporangium sp. NBC_01737]